MTANFHGPNSEDCYLFSTSDWRKFVLFVPWVIWRPCSLLLCFLNKGTCKENNVVSVKDFVQLNQFVKETVRYYNLLEEFTE